VRAHDRECDGCEPGDNGADAERDASDRGIGRVAEEQKTPGECARALPKATQLPIIAKEPKIATPLAGLITASTTDCRSERRDPSK
jgi:hypothetical protein